jgi:hypothetical protein
MFSIEQLAQVLELIPKAKLSSVTSFYKLELLQEVLDSSPT